VLTACAYLAAGAEASALTAFVAVLEEDFAACLAGAFFTCLAAGTDLVAAAGALAAGGVAVAGAGVSAARTLAEANTAIREPRSVLVSMVMSLSLQRSHGTEGRRVSWLTIPFWDAKLNTA